jgi:hypothetical protein
MGIGLMQSNPDTGGDLKETTFERQGTIGKHLI